MFRWYAVNTYSGHENKVKPNLEHRVLAGRGEQRAPDRIPTEIVSEMKDGQRVQTEKRTMPGYVLVNMELNEDTWNAREGHARRHRLRRPAEQAGTALPGRGRPPAEARKAERPRTRAQFSIGESVKVVSGPLSDFSGEISEVMDDASKLRVLVSIFGRETPVEVGFDQVKKITPAMGASKVLTDDQTAGPRSRGQPGTARRPCPGPARREHHGVLQGVQRPDAGSGRPIIPVEITVFEDRSFTFITKTIDVADDRAGDQLGKQRVVGAEIDHPAGWNGHAHVDVGDVQEMA